MSDPIETIIHALGAYWGSPIPLSILFACGACLGTLGYVFATNARNPKLRVSLLTGMYGLSIFFWAFVASSLVLCLSLSGMVAYRRWGVPTAAGGAVLIGLALSGIVSAVVWTRGAESVLRRVSTRPPDASEAWVADYAGLVARFENLPPVDLRVMAEGKPVAMAVSGRRHAVLVSTGLLSTLDRDEVQAVLAHELMHVKNHDSRFKVFSTVLSRFMFFDPFSKFFDPAVHREREYLADEMAGRTTGKPGSLASALLKLHEHGHDGKSWTAGLSIVGREGGIFSRYPPVKERISRLLLLSEILARSR